MAACNSVILFYFALDYPGVMDTQIPGLFIAETRLGSLHHKTSKSYSYRDGAYDYLQDRGNI